LQLNVLGLDGSIQNFGIAVGVIETDTWELLSIKNLVLSKTKKSTDKKTKRAEDDFARFAQHWKAIADITESVAIEWNPFYVFGEIPSGAQDARASFAFGGVTAMLAGLSLTNKVITVTPSEVKVAATGLKHADKEDVIAAMYDRFPHAPWITSKRPNAMNIHEGDGLYLTNDNEHLADAIAVILAGLEKCRENAKK
jgi:Holliday junction resolvasome RuvABC endonuclease subunit